MGKPPKIIQAVCNECGHVTDHTSLKSHSTEQNDEEYGAWWNTTYQMIECRGCHFISLKRTRTSSEMTEAEIDYYPPPVSRRKPNWYGDFCMNTPAGLDLPDLIDEVYAALHANSRRLAAMGARTLLDIAIVDSVGDVGTFAEKLEALQKNGLIGTKQRDFLEAALEAGNAAAHRGHCPTAQQLNQVMDIVESILNQIYILPHAAAELKKSTPPRKKTTK